MREIKFRGKQTDIDKWSYGAFVPDALESVENRNVDWGFIKYYDREIGKAVTAYIDRNTVGQYTGLKDKNGKEIYEGDIVNFRGEKWEIVWKASHARFVPNKKGKWVASFWDGYESNIEIVGNIYENNDLLEVVNG